MNSELDTTIQDVGIDNCEISFTVFSSVINESQDRKSISITNINFTNTNFNNEKALFSTDGIELDANLQISLSNINFSNISFLRRGTLIE